MDQDRLSGAARQVGGKIEGAVGSLTGDAKTEAQGNLRDAAGAAQNTYGQAKDAVRDAADRVSSQASDYGSQVLDQVEEAGDYIAETIDQRPLTSLLIAAGVGFLIALVTKPTRVVYRRY